MDIYRGFNLGRPLGLLQHPGLPPISASGKKVWVSTSDPLNPSGHWETEANPLDPTPRGGGSGGGGTGGGGTGGGGGIGSDPLNPTSRGGGSGGGGNYGGWGGFEGSILLTGLRRFYPPPVKCPKWAANTSGDMTGKSSCSEEEQLQLQAAYNVLTTTYASFLEQFGDLQGVSLLDCIKSKWCSIQVGCSSEVGFDVSSDPKGAYQPATEDRPTMLMSHGSLERRPPIIDVIADLLWGLILACNGRFLDVMIITGLFLDQFGGKKWEPLAERDPEYINSMTDKPDQQLIQDGTGFRTVLAGIYVWWDREHGDVGSLKSIFQFPLPVLNGDRGLTDVTKKFWHF